MKGCEFEEYYGCPNGPGGDEFAPGEYVNCGAPATEMVLIQGPEWYNDAAPFTSLDILYTCKNHPYPDSKAGMLGDWVVKARHPAVDIRV